MAKEPFKPQLRLVIQASIPITEEEQGDILYEQLKNFLRSWSEDMTLNGQLSKTLEPYCKKPQEKPTAKPGFHDFSPANPTGAKTP